MQKEKNIILLTSIIQYISNHQEKFGSGGDILIKILENNQHLVDYDSFGSYLEYLLKSRNYKKTAVARIIGVNPIRFKRLTYYSGDRYSPKNEEVAAVTNLLMLSHEEWLNLAIRAQFGTFKNFVFYIINIVGGDSTDQEIIKEIAKSHEYKLLR